MLDFPFIPSELEGLTKPKLLCTSRQQLSNEYPEGAHSHSRSIMHYLNGLLFSQEPN